MAVTVRKVSRRGWSEALKLSVHPEQKNFVSTGLPPVLMAFLKNLFSWSALPLAVFAEDDMVGFLLLTFKGRGSQLWLEHFFIDREYQARGYGKEALKAVVNIAATHRSLESIYLRVSAQNHHAKNLYINVGFIDTRHRAGRQLIYRLKLV